MFQTRSPISSFSLASDTANGNDFPPCLKSSSVTTSSPCPSLSFIHASHDVVPLALRRPASGFRTSRTRRPPRPRRSARYHRDPARPRTRSHPSRDLSIHPQGHAADVAERPRQAILLGHPAPPARSPTTLARHRARAPSRAPSRGRGGRARRRRRRRRRDARGALAGTTFTAPGACGARGREDAGADARALDRERLTSSETRDDVCEGERARADLCSGFRASGLRVASSASRRASRETMTSATMMPTMPTPSTTEARRRGARDVRQDG